MALIEQLKQIPDYRHIRGLRHPLWMLLMLSLLGFLCGYRGYRPLADFCCQHESSLRDLLGLAPTQAMPSYSTFRRTSLSVEPQGWVAVFNAWSGSTLPSEVIALWSIDGKSIRSTSTGGNTSAQNFISVVSVYEQHLGVLQVSLMENAKVSEIQVAQALIAQLPKLPTGQCFSLAALHTTQATVATIRAAQHHYLLAVKQNRAAAHAAIEHITTTASPQSDATEVDQSHGRITQRHVQVFAPSAQLRAKWLGLAFVGVVHRSGVRDHQPVEETVYYIGSAPWSAAELLQATRQHWQIENGLHWVKDVTFEEDYPPRRGRHAPVNWAILNTFAITLARRQGWRTVPQALRAWANQLHQVFSFLV
jgi:predicted transposase YbfD/YdcC